MKQIILCSFLLLNFIAMSTAQDKDLKELYGTVEINTEASTKVTPDQMVLQFDIHEKNKNFEEVAQALRTKVRQTQDLIIQSGINVEDVKVSDYAIQKEYKYEKGESQHVGYSGRASISVIQTLKDNRLPGMVEKVQEKSPGLSYNISFRASDDLIEKTKIHLLEKAYKKVVARKDIMSDKFGFVFNPNGPLSMKFSDSPESSSPPIMPYHKMASADSEMASAPIINPTDMSFHLYLSTVWERVKTDH